MTPRDDSLFNFDVEAGERITVKVGNDINIFPDINYALAGRPQDGATKPKNEAFEFDTQGAETDLTVNCTFAGGADGSYVIRVQGNKGPFVSAEPYNRNGQEAFHVRPYRFFTR